MAEKQINIKLPIDLWRRVSMAAAEVGKTKKEYVTDVLQNEIIRRVQNGSA